MKVLVIGGSGFIGRHLLARLRQDDFELAASYRRQMPSCRDGVDWHRLDANADNGEQDWDQLLDGVDVVVNCVGILRDTRAASLERVHVEFPKALYQAAAHREGLKVLHVSALGAAEEAASHYHRSKFAGEQALRESGLDHLILRPSLVYGPDGTSTRQFQRLARLPWTPLFRAGQQQVQPIHIDDLVNLMRQLLLDVAFDGRVINAVGPERISMRAYYELIRVALQRKQRRFIDLPDRLVELVAAIGDRADSSPLCRDTLIMMSEPNVADPDPCEALLGYRPASPRCFFAA